MQASRNLGLNLTSYVDSILITSYNSAARKQTAHRGLYFVLDQDK